ncbi:DUF1542 domain-containing protein [Granulicatella elegans]
MFQSKEYQEKQLRYSIRKVSFGAASVAIASLYLFMGSAAVSASEVQHVNGEHNTVTNKEEAKKNENHTEETLDKISLTRLIEEIEDKFAKGTYANKTEDSVNQLKTALGEAKSVLNNAKTQAELSQAHANLIVATTKLQTKPEEKKEAPAVDTTNGKATVGKKATNTEKASESNSIANSGSRDERNGKALNKNKLFRADTATTNDDPSANQTYTAPSENASLAELIQKLKELAEHIENNDKIKDIDSIGATKDVEVGTVKEIDEFGGWKAVEGGKFAIARKTAEGVYPLETINSTLDDTVWLQEQAFDRRTEYTLLLSKSITRANRDETAWDGSVYKPTGVAGGVTKNVARYKGIEKTFTAYSTLDGSDVIVKFKPGYVGDSDGSKANYKVQVYSITGNQETLVYETTFDPSKDANDDKKIVTKATDGKNKAKIKISNTPNTTTIDSGVDNTKRVDFIGKSEAEKLMAKPENLPNGESGTFTSKLIALPKGADHYKVRISLADQNRTGMSYQAWDEKYSVPVTGLDFSIAQDTSNVARNLLQRIYDKLKATESADKNGKTSQTIQDYEAELEKVKALLANPAARTPNFKQALQDLLAKQSSLKTDKTGLTNSKAELDALVNEDLTPGKTTDTAKAYNAAKEAAKTEIAAALTVINDENATPEQVSAALEKVNAKKTALQQAKDGLIVAATTEEKAKLKTDSDALKKVDTTGKTADSIKVYEAEFEKLKDQLEVAKNEAAAVLAKENNASKAEVQAAQAKVDAAKTALDKAAESLKDIDRDAAKKEIADAAKKATDAIEASTSLTQEQKAEEKAKVAKEAKDATDAIDNATTEEGINSAKENGKLAIEKETAITAINAEKAAKEQEIDNNTKLSDEEKSAAKAEVAKAAIEAVEAIKKADSKDAVDAAKAEGEKAIKAVNPIGKEKVLDAIQKAAEEKIAEIDKNDKLSAEEKATAKAEVAKAAIKAVEAIQNATTQDVVDAAKAEGETAIKAVNPVGKEKALEAIQTTTEAKLAEIDKNKNLSTEEKAAAKAEVAKAAIEAVEGIQKAEIQEAVNAAQAKGESAIKAVNPIGKEKALEAIQTAAEAKLAEIDKNTSLSDDEKAAAKAEVAKAAIEAVEGIQKAETQEAVNATQAKGETAIKAVNPIGKEKALEAIQTAAEAKLAEIDKNTSLSDDEKAAAKAEVAKAAIEAVEAIQKATTQEAVNAAQAKGEAAIKAVNPVGKEKALAAIKVIKDAKLAEIDKNTTLSVEEKAAAKTAVEKAYNEAVEAIQKAATQEAVNDAEAKGEAAIKAVNPFGKKDVNEAKAAVEAAAAEKIASIKANPNLSAEEKAKAIVEVERLKQEALTAIDKARTKAELEKVLRTFLYQLDQKSLVYDRPTFNIEAYIQASITGVVKVEVGKAITQADIIAKLNLPESVTVISVDLPDINTLGRTFAKVTLRLPDGTEVTVFVPVEVVESFKEDKQQNNTQEDSKPKVVPSNNSEQPTVTQTEDVKENPSNTSQESKASNQKVLPNTGTGNEISIFGSVAMTVLASLGLVATSKKKEEE